MQHITNNAFAAYLDRNGFELVDEGYGATIRTEWDEEVAADVLVADVVDDAETSLFVVALPNGTVRIEDWNEGTARFDEIDG